MATSKQKSASNKPPRTPHSIIELILDDHKPLKKLTRVLSSPTEHYSKKLPAFTKLVELLAAHAKPEEKSLYARMKNQKKLRSDAFEGETEHAIADQLVEELKGTTEEDQWMAKAKVLGELINHHIQEEEEEMLPAARKLLATKDLQQLGEDYLLLRAVYGMPSVQAA